MRFLQCILYNNDCFKADVRMKPTRIVVHSTGVNNTSLARCIQPAKNQSTGMGGKTRDEMMKLLGENKYGNHWNQSGISKCVHAFAGKLADGSIAVVQTLPYNVRAWGVGKGSKGSFNASALQIELMEDGHNSKSYCQKVFKEAVEFCAMLCARYDISVEDIVSHKEAYRMGYGSNHGDPESWIGKFGLTMDDFRNEVNKKLNGSPTLPYKVKVTVDSLNIRKGPGTEYDKVGKIKDRGVYTIIDIKGNWGLLKSKSGYIHLGYTEKYKG